MEGKALILLALLFAFLFFTPSSHGLTLDNSHLLLYEVSPYSYSGAKMDYVCIVNPSNYKVNLSGYFLTDFEGYLKLKGTIAPHEKLYVAENKSSFLKFFGFLPTWEYDELKFNGTFSLANAGDEVAIWKDNSVVDIVTYGNSNYHGYGWHGSSINITQGHILRRIGTVDTNTSEDWTNYHRIGQSDFSEISEKSNIEIFTYPDDYEELFRFVKNAKRELCMEFYTFSSEKFENEIEEKLKEGVQVKILLEGSPVGGISEGEKRAVENIYEHGGEIYFMENDNGRHNRYSFVHSKFIVRDNSSLLISTENPDEKSISPCGNRGFGVIVRDEKVAEYALRVFHDDIKEVQDIVKYGGWFHVGEEENMPIEVRDREFKPINLTSPISLVLAPDYSLQKFDEFVSSERRIDVEALYIKDYALNKIYPKSRRILVQYPQDGYSMKEFNGEKELINILHGKALIGNSSVFVGSINFCYYSLTKNRELSIIVHSQKAVNYFEKIMNVDWEQKEKLLALLKVHVSKSIVVDMRNSTGEVSEYRIYMDNKLIYQGHGGFVKISATPGRHLIKGEIVDKNGNTDEVSAEIYVPHNESFDIRIFLFFIIFAVFLYKVWKDHG